MIDPLEALRRHQEERCAVCRLERTLVVDHDHVSGLVRGLLCTRCNIMEGTGIEYPWMVEYRANPPAVAIGLVVKYGCHRPRPERMPREGRRYSRLLERCMERGAPPCPDQFDPKDWEAAYELTVTALMTFERDAIQERAAEGRAAAKAAGATGGRPAKMSAEKVAEARALYDSGQTAEQVAATLEVSRSTLYRHIR